MAKVFIFGMAGVILLGLVLGAGIIARFIKALFTPKKEKK